MEKDKESIVEGGVLVGEQCYHIDTGDSYQLAGSILDNPVDWYNTACGLSEFYHNANLEWMYEEVAISSGFRPCKRCYKDVG